MKRRTVSLCVIARDEEGAIGQAIKSALALVDEVIVVDTGSRDNTRIIAEGYGARVVDFAWRDDFSAARNAALNEAYGDWILVLDADERLDPLRPVDFQRLLACERAAGYRVTLNGPRPEACADPARQVRLFRNAPEIRYRYPVHEQVLPSLLAWAQPLGLEILEAPLAIAHAGATRERSAEKRERDVRLLRRASEEWPAEPWFEYRLAGLSLTVLEDEVLPVAGLAEGLGMLERAWQKVLALPAQARAQLPYGPDLAARIGSCRLALGDTAGALATVAAGRVHWGERPGLAAIGATAAIRRLAEAAASLPAAEAQALAARARADLAVVRAGTAVADETGPGPRERALSSLRIGADLALVEGRVADAADLYEKALTVDAGYSPAWLGLAECARYAGDRKRALQLYLRAVTANELNHRAWLRGSSVLDELGFHDNAASWRRQVALRFPEHPACAGRDSGGEDLPAHLAQPMF